MEQPKLHILSVNAHPHDFTHYAGTLGVHVSQGDTVTVVSMTAGETTHNEALADELRKPEAERDPAVIEGAPKEYVEMKARELRKACGIFGITDVRILPFPQPFKLSEHPEAIDQMRDIVLETRPQVMITQSPYLEGPRGFAAGTHDDHSETAFASLEGRNRAATPYYGATQPPHRIAATYFPGVYFDRSQMDFAVDVTDFFDKRVEAEATYVSQGHTPESSLQRMTLTLGGLGSVVHTKAAEGFVRERVELLDRIYVAPSALRDATESHDELMARRLG